MNDYWEGFRWSFRRGVAIGLVNIAVIVMLIVNFQSYMLQSSVWFVALRLVWILMFTGWVIVQLYVWPLLDELIKPTLRAALRNAALMVVLNPFFSLTLFLTVLLLVVFSTLFAVPWILLSLSLIVNIANAAVINRLDRARSCGQIRLSA